MRVKINELWDASFEILIDDEVVATAKSRSEADQKALVAEMGIHRLTDPTRQGGPDERP